MEVISLKLDKHMLKDIDKSLKKNNFSTRTEFVRTAIRKQLKEMTRDELIQAFLATAGTAKKKTSDAELRKARDAAYKELVKERGWD